jgi:hypothetical protein
MTVMARTVFAWAMEGSVTSLQAAIHEAFELLKELAGDWSADRPPGARRGHRHGQ